MNDYIVDVVTSSLIIRHNEMFIIVCKYLTLAKKNNFLLHYIHDTVAFLYCRRQERLVQCIKFSVAN